MKKRLAFLFMLLASCMLCTACSYSTDFAVVNSSGQPIQVQYRIRQFPGPAFDSDHAPVTIAARDLDSSGKQDWKPLTSDQFLLDQANRSITVRVAPGDALRIAQMPHYFGHDDPGDAREFPVDEIIISGANGELRLTGTQARTTFGKVSQVLYTLTYH